MVIALIGKDKIYKTTLPDISKGDYWISDEQDKKLVNIKMIDNKCYISSSSTVRIINPKYINEIHQNFFDKELDKAIVKECYVETYSIHYIAIKGIEELFILYAMPTCEKFEKYDITNALELFIGSGEECHIQADSPIIKRKHARIYYSNTQLMLENLDTDYGTFINNRPCRKICKTII